VPELSGAVSPMLKSSLDNFRLISVYQKGLDMPSVDDTARVNFGPRHAYVLDDEPEIAAIVCHVLNASGFAPRPFAQAVPFLTEVKRVPPELVVLDLALGQSDAIEIIRQLEVLKYKGNVLLITGRDEATLIEVNQIGERHGLCMLPPLKKPFRPADLQARLAPQPANRAAACAEPKTPIEREDIRRIKVDLGEALDKKWLELWYQPKIDLKSMRVSGAEALVRARHPEFGIVKPTDLLPPPGDPLFRPLSTFVIRRALADWDRLADHGLSLKLAVNMPASVLDAPDFITIVRQLLPTDPRFPGLIIEVTEDEIIRDPQWAHELATQLKLYKVWLSIDDFGSGYASLSRLHDLPFMEVKIDRLFVHECASNQLKQALCQTVVDLAHRFGATVCAEGLETADDLRCLLAMGCDTAQGYLFGRPMPLDQFARALLGRAERMVRAAPQNPQADETARPAQSA